MRLKKAGLRPTHVEGYNQAEWVLVDYVDFVVHVFSEKARKFYDQAVQWMEKNKNLVNSDPRARQIFPRLQAEAGQVLGVEKKKD